MGKKKVYQKKKRIPQFITSYSLLNKQRLNLKEYDSRYYINLVKNKIEVYGAIRPTPLCKTYKFKIVYVIGLYPKTFIIEPEIISYGENIPVPHVYGKNRPCLFYPKNKEFTEEMMISETIIPWLSLWLYYYEVWFATGEWLGGGIHPGDKEENSFEI